MKTSYWDSLVFRVLINTLRRQGRFYIRPWWKPLHDYFLQRKRTVHVTVHGRQVIANFGYTYPLVVRQFPTFNNPLVELVHNIHRQRNRPVRFVDVGAAIGDTVLLVNSNCAEMVSDYLCVDGDIEFFAYLQKNLEFLPNARCILRQLSRSRGTAPELIRTHAGTASAQGELRVETAPLDDLFAEANAGKIDVLKVDVDGFDGEVLAGAKKTLREDRPGVIFEWHPILCRKIGNDWMTAFDALIQSGYTKSAWFTKFGTFSHFANLDDRESITKLGEFCTTTRSFDDWHFDVVALHDDDASQLLPLAELEFARHRRSPF